MTRVALLPPYGLVQPRPDRDSAPFWEALRQRRLAVQRCDGCGAYRFPARCICNRCGSWATQWTDSAGTGEIVSYAVVHHPLTADFAPTVPYHLLAVRLDEQEDLIVPGGLAAGLESYVSIGVRVRADFADVAPGLTLLKWRLDPSGPDQATR